MAAYWVLFSVYAFAALAAHTGNARNRMTLPLALGALGLTLVIGLRWDIGPDWSAYHAIFKFARFQTVWPLHVKTDPGFQLLLALVHSFGGGFFVLNLICAAIFSFGLVHFSTLLPNPWLGILVAIPYLVIVIAMSALRQSVAIGFVFLALRDVGSKPLWKSVGWVIVGSTFHASAIIMAILIGISYQRSRLQAVTLLLVCALPLYYMLSGTFDQYVYRYGSRKISSGGVGFRVGMSAIPALIYLFRGRRDLTPAGEDTFWRNVAVFALLMVPAMFLVTSNTVIDRLSIYAIPLQIVILAALPLQMGSGLRERLLSTAAICAYCGLTLYVYFSFGSHARFYAPYQAVKLL